MISVPEIPPAVDSDPKPYTAADLQWWAENSPANADGYDVTGPAPSDGELDQAAGCAPAQARLDAGYSLF